MQYYGYNTCMYCRYNTCMHCIYSTCMYHSYNHHLGTIYGSVRSAQQLSYVIASNGFNTRWIYQKSLMNERGWCSKDHHTQKEAYQIVEWRNTRARQVKWNCLHMHRSTRLPGMCARCKHLMKHMDWECQSSSKGLRNHTRETINLCTHVDDYALRTIYH